jgi:acetyl esterase/lipase
MLRALALAVLSTLLPGLAAQSTTFPALVYGTVAVGGSPHNLLLDLVVPTGAGPWPVVVWIHGGGWSGGSRLPIPGSVTRLVPRGYAVASIDYRLTGQAIWPAQIHDCKAAIRHLRANAATWGLDPDRIGVMGSSAGGHLVAALATMGGVGTVRSGSHVVDLEGGVGPHTATSSRVQCAVDLFGPTDMLLANDFPTFDHDSANSPESHLVGGALQANPEKWATADPISFVTPDDAPLLALHGTDDTSVPFVMSELLVAAAKAIGNDVALLPIPGNGHGGPGFSAPAVTAITDAFFDRTLRDLPAVDVAVAATDALGGENGDPATFVVSRTGSTASALVVRLWQGGSAEVGRDHEPLPLLVTIPAGQASTSLTLLPLQDALVEGPETVVLHVLPSGEYRIAHAASSATATIADDDAAVPIVSLQQLDAAATEAPGDPGAIRCVRTGSVAAPLAVHYYITGTAENGVDYLPLSGTATIPAGSSATAILVLPLQDTGREPGETVVLQLAASADYARSTDRSAHVVIADDERSSPLPVVGVIATAPAAAETGTDGAFRITRTGPTSLPLSVGLTTGGSAAAGFDHVALPASVAIPAGSAWVDVPVAVLDDAVIEGVENVSLAIAPSTSFLRAPHSASEVLVSDDEAPPSASAVALAMGPLSAGGTNVTTIANALPLGVAALWFSQQPACIPLPPFGLLQIDLSVAAPYTLVLLDGEGSAHFVVDVQEDPSLIGSETWWQAVATTTPGFDLTLSDAVRHRIGARTSVIGP